MSVEQLVTDHLTAWNSPPSAERSDLIAAVYRDDVYVGEPGAQLNGHEGAGEAIDALQQQAPDGTLTRTSDIVQVQDLLTYTWELSLPGPGVVATGKDIVILDGGTIARLYVVIDAPA